MTLAQLVVTCVGLGRVVGLFYFALRRRRQSRCGHYPGVTGLGTDHVRCLRCKKDLGYASPWTRKEVDGGSVYVQVTSGPNLVGGPLLEDN